MTIYIKKRERAYTPKTPGLKNPGDLKMTHSNDPIWSWKFMTQTGLILSNLTLGQKFCVKYVHPGARVNLTQFASVAY